MKQKLLDGLNRTAEILVLFDATDLSSLGQAYLELTSLKDTAQKHEATDVVAALGEMTDITEKIVMGEPTDFDGLVDALSSRISWLSNAIREEKQLSECPRYDDDIISVMTISDDPVASNDNAYYREIIAAFEREPEIVQDFVLEAKDHLENCSPALLELERNPEDMDNLNLVFRCFHSIKGVAGFLNLAMIQRIAHRAEDILDNVRSGARSYNKKISNLMFEASDALTVMISDIGKIPSGEITGNTTVDFSDLIARLEGALTPEDMVIDFSEDPDVGIGNCETDPPPPPIADFHAGGLSLSLKAEASKVFRRDGRKEIIKVDADRLNRLIDTIGELVIAETIVLESDETRQQSNPFFLRKISQLDKITRELQTMGMSLRMVAVKPTFQNMARLVRDLAEKQGKKIEFFMRGEDTEIDKNIVDRIGDPLVHMIRNAVDHGIESTDEERIATGKPPVAKVEISAFHRGGNICIEIKDDGRGIHPDIIFKKAVAKGIVSADANLSKTEIINLIFAPGFSTAEKVTDVSGRGVGMDVVKRNISELNGQVEIFSEPGQGSTFSIRLPLTLAIIDGMIVRVAEERFIIPTLSITRAVNINPRQIHRLEGREFAFHQSRNIPLYRLDRFLGLTNNSEPKDILMLILDDGENIAGIIVDELIGKQQIVIKSLGSALQLIDGFSGCAILSDGTVGLIIDVNSVIKNYTGKTPR